MSDNLFSLIVVKSLTTDEINTALVILQETQNWKTTNWESQIVTFR